LSSRKIVLISILVLLAATGFTVPGLLVSKTAHELQPPRQAATNLIADPAKGNATLTQLEEGKATPLGGSGQVVFQYYCASPRYWQRGADGFIFSYTVKSNWYADLAITVKCLVGESTTHGFFMEFGGQRQHIIKAYQTVTSSFWVYSSGSGTVGLKTLFAEIWDTVAPWWLYDQRNMGNQYLQTYPSASDPGPGDYATETDDLIHPRVWDIMLKAGQFCDNTADQYTSAFWINWWTGWTVQDIETSDSLQYAFSDLYTIVGGHWWGVCDEHAIAFSAMCRAMNIPTHFLVIWPQGQGTGAHACAEVRIGSSWIHADPTWFAFNNPTLYAGWGWTNVSASIVHDSYDWLYNGDPLGDNWLLWYNDMTLYGEPPYGPIGYYWGY
jgi:hypothetical protein